MVAGNGSKDGASARTSRMHTLRARLGAATGFSTGMDFARHLGRHHPLDRLADIRSRLADNLCREEELTAAPFATVLRVWGISSPAGDEETARNLALYVRSKRREACILGLLTLTGLAACYASLLFPARVAIVRILAGLACTSFVAASALMCLAACWRVRVCTQQHFVPFVHWLAQSFLPWKQAATSPSNSPPHSPSKSPPISPSGSCSKTSSRPCARSPSERPQESPQESSLKSPYKTSP